MEFPKSREITRNGDGMKTEGCPEKIRIFASDAIAAPWKIPEEQPRELLSGV
ncbi:MAG TPA: hypothetical protein PK765_00840 [bacterium]|nr:hypothetical protein [bacterium]